VSSASRTILARELRHVGEQMGAANVADISRSSLDLP
jgi:hypothetical protein